MRSRPDLFVPVAPILVEGSVLDLDEDRSIVRIFIIIYLAALQNIPGELYEAAELDGAGRWRTFQYITLPQLTPVIFFNMVMGVVAAVQYFTQAYVVSGGTGGPEDSTRVLSLHVFLWAFKYQEAGYASAAAWTLFVLVLVITIFLFRTGRHWVHYGG